MRHSVGGAQGKRLPLVAWACGTDARCLRRWPRNSRSPDALRRELHAGNAMRALAVFATQSQESRGELRCGMCCGSSIPECSSMRTP